MYLRLTLLLAASVLISSCDDKGKSNVSNGETTQLTPDEQKVKLEETAKQIINTFNTADQKAVLELADYFVYQYGDYSWEKVGEHFEDDFAIFHSMSSYAKRLASGNITKITNEVYDFPEATGVFQANSQTHEWEYVGDANKGEVILRFENDKGVMCEAKLVGSGETVEYSGEYETDNGKQPFTVIVPTSVVLTLKEGETEHIRISHNVDVKRGDYLNQDITVRVANLNFTSNLRLTKTQATEKVQLNYDTQSLINAEISLPACVLLDKGEMDWEQWLEQYYNVGESSVKYGRVIAQVNIMGTVQIKGACNNFDDLFCGMVDLNDKYGSIPYENWWESPWRGIEYNTEVVDLLNNALTVSLYYNSDVEQARLQVEVDSDEETFNTGDNYETHTVYNYVPVIYFPSEGTAYALDYFEKYEQTYNSIYDMLIDLVNDYIALAKYNEIDPIR